MDHFGFSFIKAKSIVMGPDPNVFKATLPKSNLLGLKK